MLEKIRSDPWFHNPDRGLRYLVALDLLHAGPEDTIVDVGSGWFGASIYCANPVVAIEMDLGPLDTPPPTYANVAHIIGNGADLPCRDGSSRFTVSCDSLEHVPTEFREAFISEISRITSGRLVLGFPAGAEAHAHDKRLYDYHLRFMEPYPPLVEHLEYPLPDVEQVKTWLQEQGFKVRLYRHHPIWIREMHMRLAFRGAKSVWANRLQTHSSRLLFPLRRYLFSRNGYRVFVVADRHGR